VQRRDGKLIVSATDLVGFLECGHLSALDLAVANGTLEKPHFTDATLDLIRDRGGRHEVRYIEQLEREGRRITRLDGDRARPYEERAAETIVAMRRGDDVIYQATVFDGRWVGHPDFLLRVVSHVNGSPGAVMLRRDSEGGQSEGGQLGLGLGAGGELGLGLGAGGGLGRDFHYEVADTKLAHSAKASALIQICSYVDQIAQIQGITPERVYVVTGGANIESHPFRTAEMMAYYRHAKGRFEQALAAGLDHEKSYPDPVEHCGVCRWQVDCNRRWHADDALPIVAGITRSQRTELKAVGIETRRGLAGSDVVGFDRVREQARVQVESDGKTPPMHELLKPEKDSSGAWVADRGLSALPAPSVGDLFFDIEGDPFALWEGLEYLFGVWDPSIRETDPYVRFWALNREEEKGQFEQVIDLFTERRRADPGMHVYHFGAYEPSHLKRLAGRHATREEELDELLRGRVFVDLYRVVRQGLRAGVESYSIKKLEPLYGYERTIDLREAGDSIVEFEKWLDGWLEDGVDDQKLRADIAAYNRDDCISTLRLRDWLESLRADAARQFGRDLPRPVEKAVEEAQRPRDPEVVALEQALTASLPAGADRPVGPDRPDLADPHARWLLAQLLDWHRRERKSAFWRFFELMTLSPQELIEEKEPIGGLVYEGIVGEARGGRKIHRYRFPAQEHDVGDRSTLHDPAKVPFEGSDLGPFTIDDDNLTLDCRRKQDWSGAHPLAVVPDNIVYTEAQEDALKRIARWVVADGIESGAASYRAARDLLRRLPPRAGQSAAAVLVRSGSGEAGSGETAGETGKEAALRRSGSLDHTTLAIQGPPGSGKTWTGARMILSLVRAGRKVGITSNSHKVIGNLLRAVCDAAWEESYPLRPMQKAGKDEVAVHEHIEIRRADDNGEVLEALDATEVEVVGGTPWLWARAEMEGKVHTLFVDEAGQVSLANVIALSAGAQNVVLLGDPQQLDQPTQGVHPEGADRSALAHLLNGAEVIPPGLGIFLEHTWRMHPGITDYTSDLFYRGQLRAVEGLERQRLVGDDWLSGSGLRWVPVEHDGNTDESLEEALAVERIWRGLVGREWVNRDGLVRPIGADGIVIVSPFNAHRKLLLDRLPAGARVGTVDKFQGQEAPVSIYTMATSRPEDAPRGMSFLYSLNRLNVATSRARALAIVVASPRLLEAVARSPDQVRMANGLCAFVETTRLTGP